MTTVKQRSKLGISATQQLGQYNWITGLHFYSQSVNIFCSQSPFVVKLEAQRARQKAKITSVYGRDVGNVLFVMNQIKYSTSTRMLDILRRSGASDVPSGAAAAWQSTRGKHRKAETL